jgi:hypothetical protein
MTCRRLLWPVLTPLLFLFGCEGAVGPETMVIHDVTVIDGTGAPPREHVDLVLRDGRIASIEDASTAGRPGGARVIDGRGKYVMPGLVDMHAHVAGDVLNEKGEPRSHVHSRDSLSRRLTAPSRFWMSAPSTVSRWASVSVTMWRLRPFLLASKAARAGVFSGRDQLAVDDAGRRAGLAPRLLARIRYHPANEAVAQSAESRISILVP